MNLRKLFASMVACVCFFTPCIALASKSVNAQACFKQEYEVINARVFDDDINGEKDQTAKFAMDLARVYQVTGHYAEWFQPSLQEVQDYNLLKNAFIARNNALVIYIDTTYADHQMTEDQIAKAHTVFQNKHNEFVSLAKSLLQKYGS